MHVVEPSRNIVAATALDDVGNGHEHAAVRHLARERFGESDYASLARHVVRNRRTADLAQLGSDVDDAAIASLEHLADEGP